MHSETPIPSLALEAFPTKDLTYQISVANIIYRLGQNQTAQRACTPTPTRFCLCMPSTQGCSTSSSTIFLVWSRRLQCMFVLHFTTEGEMIKMLFYYMIEGTQILVSTPQYIQAKLIFLALGQYYFSLSFPGVFFFVQEYFNSLPHLGQIFFNALIYLKYEHVPSCIPQHLPWSY